MEQIHFIELKNLVQLLNNIEIVYIIQITQIIHYIKFQQDQVGDIDLDALSVNIVKQKINNIYFIVGIKCPLPFEGMMKI